MKKFVFSLFFFSALFAVAQNKSTIETKALIRDYSKAKSVEGMSQTLLSRLPIRQRDRPSAYSPKSTTVSMPKLSSAMASTSLPVWLTLWQ